MGIHIGVTSTSCPSLNHKIWRNFRAVDVACSHPKAVCGIAPLQKLQLKPRCWHGMSGRSDQTSLTFRILLSTAFGEIRESGYRKGLTSGDWAVKCASFADHESGDNGGGGDSGGGNYSRRGTGGNDDGQHESSEGSEWWWCWLLFRQWLLPLFLRAQNLQGKSNFVGNFGNGGGFDWDHHCCKFAVMLADMALCGSMPLPIVGIAGALALMTAVGALGGLCWLMWKTTRSQDEEGGDEKTAQEEEMEAVAEEEMYCIDGEGYNNLE